MKTGLDQSINDNTVKNYNFKIFYVIVAQTIHFPIIGEMEILKEEKVLIVFLCISLLSRVFKLIIYLG
jgi:hypothetical protein